MLKFKDNKFSPLPETDLKTNGLLERANLQEAIVNSWQAFTKEIEMPDLQFVGQEVIPDDRIQDRIDVLAFDPNDSIPVVIELKRSKDKYQLLQSIAYAAMISSWDSERFLNEAKKQNKNNNDLEEVKDSLSTFDADKKIRIVLVAEEFGPETMVAAHWLYENFDLDIIAISINVFKRQDDIYFNFEQKIPLQDLHDTYVLRKKVRNINPDESERNWEEVADTFKYEWGKELLERCQKERKGSPKHKRFGSFRTSWDGFDWISLHFKIKFVNIYICGNPDNAEELLQSKFKDSIEVNSWRDGYSFHVTERSQYEDLCEWLKIKKLD